MKADDSSLTAQQLFTVRASARKLLDKGGAWDTFPTPVDSLMEAAGLTLAPMSAFDEGSMRRFMREAGEKAAALLRSALDKVMGILDVQADLVHIDPDIHKDRLPFLKLHETGHNELPHQKGIYRWIQDCAKHLDPATADLFEREANVFASIVLFKDDGFAKHTADAPFGVRAPLAAARHFGSSRYAAFREYVRKHHKTCAVVVLEPTTYCPTAGISAAVRRIEVSQKFAEMFGALQLPDVIGNSHYLMPMVPLEPRKMSSPKAFSLTDRNGVHHEFVGEGFRTSFNTFVLVHEVATLGKVISFRTSRSL